jgi:glycosyltransferase involved in cell wall biosynthesis
MLSNTHLALFFTKKTSLTTWYRVGNLDREIALYKKLAEILKEVKFITYGGHNDKKFSEILGRIKLISVRWHKSEINILIELILRHYPELRDTHLLKTNQIKGAEIPIWFKKRFGKTLIVRCGYLHSYFIKQKTNDQKEIENAVRLEKEAFTSADLGIVTSKWQKDIIIEDYNIDREKIKVIPNYVLTDVFKPYSDFKKDYDLIYVGRSREQKNLKSLLEALYHLKRKNKKLSILMIGGCSSDIELRKLATQYDLAITFKDNVPNFNLPIFLNKSKVFILPSKYEGHPKALIEAMSCGLPCIGSNVVGIKEVIKHKENGYLCTTDYKSITEAIEVVLADKSLRKTMGDNARKYVLSNCSLDIILKKELEVIKEVMEK